MAIKITTMSCADNLQGKSHWWGFPDLPKDVEWPCRSDEELLTFICQIRLEEIADLDTDNRLPHNGMLWFFADLDYFLGDIDAPCGGIGEWEKEFFRVIYSEDCSELCTHEYYWEDGSLAVLEAEKIAFEDAGDEDFGFKLLGMPAMTEGYENENEGMLSLLQLDEEDRWVMRFFDSGTINFMMPLEAMLQRDYSQCSLFLHSS